MTTSLLNLGESTFRVEQDYEEYRTLAPERDPDWCATDSNGHEHYMQDGKYPTLEWVVTGTYWCEMHNEDHKEGEWRCRECGEHVSPGMRPPGPGSKRVPTMRHYFINDEPVSEETFRKAIAEAEAQT